MEDSFETVVQLGKQPIRIKTSDPNRLIQLFSYYNDLNQAAEGRDVVPFYRSTKDGYEYYGLRDASGVEVTFGQQKKPNDPSLNLFAYRPGIDGYKGWKQYNGRQIEQQVGGNGRQRPDHYEEESDPGEKEIDYGIALQEMRKYLQAADKQGIEALDQAITTASNRITNYPATAKNMARTILDEFEAKLPEPEDDLPF